LATIGYDEVWNRQSVTRLNGVTSAYTYDGLDRLDTLTHQRGGTPLAFYDYRVRGDGKRDSVGEESLLNADLQNGTQRLTHRNLTFNYDDSGRLTREVGQDGNGIAYRDTWNYDAAGNRISATYEKAAGAGAITYSHTTSISAVFNANDWLTNQTTQQDEAAAQTTTWTYDSNGAEKTVTPEGGITATNTWGFEGQLLGVNGTTDTVNSYDAEGNRLHQSITIGTATRTTKWLVDPNASYAQAVQERDETNTLQARYIWGSMQSATTPTVSEIR
jgi:YD repeat-containing protein